MRITLMLLLAAAAHAETKEEPAKKVVAALVNAGLELKADAKKENAVVTVEKLECSERAEAAGDDSADPYFGLARYQCRRAGKALGEAGLLWQALSALSPPDCKMGGKCSISLASLTCTVHLKATAGRFECAAKP